MRIRKERVAQLIKTEVSEMILKELKDPRIGFVSVTDVDVSGDLRYATVYFSVLGDEEAVKSTIAALKHATGYVRREIGNRLRLRYAPEIRFKYDEVFQRAWHLEEVIRELHESEETGGSEQQGETEQSPETP
jgi:ribosome-binding factor A